MIILNHLDLQYLECASKNRKRGILTASLLLSSEQCQRWLFGIV